MLSSLLQSQQQRATQAGSAATGSSSTNPFANLQLTAQQQAELRSILMTAQSENLTFAQLQHKIAGVLGNTGHENTGKGVSATSFHDIAAQHAISAQLRPAKL